jgi:hypothetical protein
MAAEARLDFFILRSVARDGAILIEPEASHEYCAALDAALALLSWEST